MPIIGTNFIKIDAERKDTASRNLRINNNLGISKIEDMNLSLGASRQDGLKFIFEYTVLYEPDAAHMKLTGEVLFIDDAKVIKEIKQQWKDKKPVKEDIMTAVMNSALTKSAIKALQMSQDLGLPAPIKLPRVTKKEEAQKT
jgi:hypothetical protein